MKILYKTPFILLLLLTFCSSPKDPITGEIKRIEPNAFNLKVIAASADEIVLHEQRLDLVAKSGKCLWRGSNT